MAISDTYSGLSGHTLTDWCPEDEKFWKEHGRSIASRNLWISIPCLLLAFSVWLVWSVVVAKLPAIGFNYTTDQLFWLAALPGARHIRAAFEKRPRLARIFILAIPLPYIAIECGWFLAEVGRQPWIVSGLMKTSNAVSPIEVSQVATSFIGFLVLYSVLGAADFYLLARVSRRGPEPAAEGRIGEEV